MRAPLVVLVSAGLASAHFGIEYPVWRADSLNNESYSQYIFPCAGVPTDLANGNRTDWPATGGSLSLDLHHPWSYIYINIGLGDNVTNFNYSLTPSFLNETGKGILCLDHLPLPVDLAPSDGQHATIQVVAGGKSGSALYNCADITFRTNATITNYGNGNCTTSEGVSYQVVVEQTNTTSSASDASPTASGAASTATGAGSLSSVNAPVLTSVVAMAMVFMYGMSS
ncbi:expression library immunization antigen 1 [Ophiostoma piceae UAMH 11346]|uniref:Expression library immunization antigen 1 n=1 Tax=Ophiostoma piceae (strain UAMH 11346) TaxID=1262450 RepID=S3CT21_OPHP1|nr:expression library immunization antigen 1 [Ophiostoma piceae UAMH 11346]